MATKKDIRPQAKKIADFDIYYYQYLNHLGKLVRPAPEFATSPEYLIKLYRAMMLARLFDKKAIALQRTGQIGTYASSQGQEAIGAVLGTIMEKDDVLLPSYREYAAQILRGVSMTEILLYWGGDERGMDYQVPRQDFPITVTIGGHTAQAAGVAFAFKYREQSRVAVCVMGDGASSKGDFYEAMNIAGAWKLPLLFVVVNNQWAISVPRKQQTAAKTLAQKAIAAGFNGEQVDGNDVIALSVRLQNALDTIRNGSGPVLIETLTYRMSDHTTADDASRYRPTEEVEKQQSYDPLARLHDYLGHHHDWQETQEKQLIADCSHDIEAAVKAYLEYPQQPVASMFEHLYAQLPDSLKSQQKDAIRRSRNG